MDSGLGPDMSRRLVMKLMAGTGALIVAQGATATLLASDDKDYILNFKGDIGPYIKINPDNSIIVGSPSPEIGSGMHQTAAMLIADELGADINRVEVRQLPVEFRRREDEGYSWAYGQQGGGGSFTTRGSWIPVRQIAAVTRQVLITAAAQHMRVDAARLRAVKSHIEVADSDQRVAFADVAALASKLPFPEPTVWRETEVKQPDAFMVIGTDHKNKANREVVDGSAIFGIDAEMDGMLHAAIVHAPTFTATIGAIDDTETRAVRGVVDVVKLDNPDQAGYLKHAVAVVADNYWAAQKGLKALKVQWDQPPVSPQDSTNGMHEKLHELLRQPGAPVVKDGQGGDHIADAATVVDAEYALPSLAHGTMEPMNCIVDASDEAVRAIEPGHNTSTTARLLARASGKGMDEIQLELTRTGGSFGRRLWSDYAMEAYTISKAVQRPVKLVWSRESDLTVEGFRVTSRQRLRAGLNADGRITSWHHRTAHATNPKGNRNPPEQLYQETTWTHNFPRGLVPNFELDFHTAEWNLMQGPWRAPMPSQQGFIAESFMNELAHAAGEDPLTFRLKHLDGVEELPYPHWGGPTWSPQRLANCLKSAAEKAGWGTDVPAGRARGIAGYFTFGSYCALVVEASLERGLPRVHKVAAAIDCGLCVNPNGTRSQIEGGINDALSATLYQSATVEQGRAIKDNFDTYQLMRMDDAPPEISVEILHTRDDIFGTGEISVAPFAPALTDAMFQLTGKRIRELPIGDQLAEM